MGSPVEKTSSCATYFYIGDGGVNAPVVLHRFRAGRPQKEVPVKPTLVFVEACLALAERSGQRVMTIESPLPESYFFGELPGAFVENKPASARVLWSLLRAQRCAEASNSLEVAWASRVEAVLGPFTFLALWGFGPCYRQHTRKAILQGTCLAAWPVALSHCWRLRHRAHTGGHGREALQRRVEELRRFLDEWQEFRKTFDESCGDISLDDLTALAYLRCLAAIPEELLPIELSLQKRLRDLTQVLENRYAAAQFSDGAVAPLRWSEAHEEGDRSRSASKTVEVTKGTPQSGNFINGILSFFLNDFVKDWDSPNDEDAEAQPLSPTLKRGNLVFVTWLLGSSALYAVAAIVFKQRTET